MRAIIALFAILMFLTSCSSYINSLHRQISREERAQSAQSRAPQRRGYINDRKPINNPVTLNGAPNQLTPKLERDLERMRKRRMKSSDLVDNSQAPSLWNGSSDESYLFIKQNVRRPGDIVIIDVHSNMKIKFKRSLKELFLLFKMESLQKEVNQKPVRKRLLLRRRMEKVKKFMTKFRLKSLRKSTKTIFFLEVVKRLCLEKGNVLSKFKRLFLKKPYQRPIL
jgi:hypothetical protein